MKSTPASAGVQHQLLHARDHRGQSVDDRLADQEVADIELHHFRQRGDRTDVVECQAVAGVAFQAK